MIKREGELRIKIIISIIIPVLILFFTPVFTLAFNKSYHYQYEKNSYMIKKENDDRITQHYFIYDIDPTLTGHDRHLEIKRIMEEMIRELNITDNEIIDAYYRLDVFCQNCW